MDTPLDHMNMHAKNRFSSFFRLVRIQSFLYYFEKFNGQLLPNEESQGHKILHAYPYGPHLYFW